MAEIADLGMEAMRQIVGAPFSEQKRFLLWNCLEAYLPLEQKILDEMGQMLNTEKYTGAKAMNRTT